MGVADWDITTEGSGSFGHYEALHSAKSFFGGHIPDLYPSDTKCRRLDNSHASEFGRALFKYSREPENFTIYKDVSVRAWIGMGVRDAESHAGVACRMDTSVPTTVANAPGIFDNGYYLSLRQKWSLPGGSLTLDRYNAGARTTLYNLDVVLAPGIYVWYGVRLDFLWQSSGSALLRGYSRSIAAPDWAEAFTLEEASEVIPPYDGVGWGGQVEGGGAELINEAYVDLVEVFHSV